MRTILEIIGGISVSSIIAFSLLKYLSKKLFEQELTKDLEKFKNDLNRESKAIEIELNKFANTYNTKFTSLHSERATVIKNLYNNIYNYNLAVGDFFWGEDYENPDVMHRKLDAWSKAVLNFSSHFHVNRIFFKKETAEKLNNLNNQMDEINQKVRELVNQFESYNELSAFFSSNTKEVSDVRTWNKEMIENIIMPIQSDLENEFRELLGVETKE